MMKKIVLLLFVCATTLMQSQENENRYPQDENKKVNLNLIQQT